MSEERGEYISTPGNGERLEAGWHDATIHKDGRVEIDLRALHATICGPLHEADAQEVARLQVENQRLRSAVEAVEALHRQHVCDLDAPCQDDYCAGCLADWPCSTIAALDFATHGGAS